MKLVPLNTKFDIKYGNQFDLSKMSVLEESGGVNFISRSSKNFGIVARVVENIMEPNPPGLITVTLGGSYLLTAFVQPERFYTAQNIKVLTPQYEMSFNEKLFYCICIEKNRYKYSSHGREGNVSLDTILVPEKFPEKFKDLTINNLENKYEKALSSIKEEINISKWGYFSISKLFDIHKGREQIGNSVKGTTPLISAIAINGGITSHILFGKKIYPSNCITVAMNGVSTAEAFYQEREFYATPDVNVLIPKFHVNKYIGFFICIIIKQEKFRFSYGRKWSKEKMLLSEIKLPSKNGNPDFDFMEKYIKSLPFSSGLNIEEETSWKKKQIR
jgi:hypothetical protein